MSVRPLHHRIVEVFEVTARVTLRIPAEQVWPTIQRVLPLSQSWTRTRDGAGWTTVNNIHVGNEVTGQRTTIRVARSRGQGVELVIDRAITLDRLSPPAREAIRNTAQGQLVERVQRLAGDIETAYGTDLGGPG